MEALSAGVDDNPSSVKSDDSSPRHGSGAGSPPPNCAICLGTCKNKSFTDSCLHQFCFSCLLTWSKVKAECPLCKQAFRSIIHNVRSNHQYEEYLVVQRQNEESSSRIDIDSVTAAARRYRFRGTFTLPRRETIAIQQLLMHYNPLMAFSPHAAPAPAPASRAPPARRRREPVAFRRTVYRHNLWARPLPDFTGRFRDCSPEFYRYNDTQVHRLVPWLNRELHYLLNENVGHISYVMTRILELLPQHHINSHDFREAMQRYFGDRTEHFLHELYCFASTPYDMTGYDRNVQYTTDSRISTMVNEVISSSDSDSVDSDIVMVSSSEPGPSRLPPPAYPPTQLSYMPPARGGTGAGAGGVIPIETISHSESDDSSSEVLVVGYIKPPHERTPEVVDLLGSDSDVVLQDPQETPEAPSTWESTPVREPVKLTLQRVPSPTRASGAARPGGPAAGPGPAGPAAAAARAPSDSDDTATYTPPMRLLKRAYYTDQSSISTPCRSRSPSPSVSPDSSWERRSKTTVTTATWSSSSDESSERSRVPRKKKKMSRGESSRDRRRNKPQSSRSRYRDKKTEKDKRSDRKSRSGKGVKSSKRSDAPALTPAAERPADQPGPSGVPRTRPTRDTRESRRLRSVVNIIKHKRDESVDSVSQSSVLNNPPGSEKTDSRASMECRDSRNSSLESSETDSEDNLPLNLTLQKMSPRSSS